MYKIAICDDDKRYRKTIREIIEHENSLPENEIRFYEYESGNELLKHTDILHELVFIDIRMPGLDGNQTALKLRNYNKDAVLIFYSSYFEPTVDSINFGQPLCMVGKNTYRSAVRNRIGWMVNSIGNFVGCAVPLWWSWDSYQEMAASSGFDANTLNMQFSMVTSPALMLLGVVITAVLAILGTLFGQRLLRKHFQKAGIVG